MKDLRARATAVVDPGVAIVRVMLLMVVVVVGGGGDGWW